MMEDMATAKVITPYASDPSTRVSYGMSARLTSWEENESRYRKPVFLASRFVSPTAPPSLATEPHSSYRMPYLDPSTNGQ